MSYPFGNFGYNPYVSGSFGLPSQDSSRFTFPAGAAPFQPAGFTGFGQAQFGGVSSFGQWPQFAPTTQATNLLGAQGLPAQGAFGGFGFQQFPQQQQQAPVQAAQAPTQPQQQDQKQIQPPAPQKIVTPAIPLASQAVPVKIISTTSRKAGEQEKISCCTDCNCEQDCALRKANIPCCGPTSQCAHHLTSQKQ